MGLQGGHFVSPDSREVNQLRHLKFPQRKTNSSATDGAGILFSVNFQIAARNETFGISCIPISCGFAAAIPVRRPASRRLIASAPARSRGATFLPMRRAGLFRNALPVPGHLQSWRPSSENDSRRPAFGNVRRPNATARVRSCNESRALRLIGGLGVNSGKCNRACRMSERGPLGPFLGRSALFRA